MLSTNTFSLLSLLALPLSISAQFSCNAKSAITVEELAAAIEEQYSSSSSSGGDGSGTSCSIYPTCPSCDVDPTFEICRSWHQTQLNDDLNTNMLNGAELLSNSVRRRATLECADSEVCVSGSDNLFFCLDPSTYYFVDSNGGSGNLGSDTYTMGNGQVTEVASTATSLPTPTSGSGSGSGTTVSAAGAQNTGSGSSSSSSSSSNSGDSSSAVTLGVNGFLDVAVFVMGTVNVLL